MAFTKVGYYDERGALLESTPKNRLFAVPMLIEDEQTGEVRPSLVWYRMVDEEGDEVHARVRLVPDEQTWNRLFRSPAPAPEPA